MLLPAREYRVDVRVDQAGQYVSAFRSELDGAVPRHERQPSAGDPEVDRPLAPGQRRRAQVVGRAADHVRPVGCSQG